MGCRADRGSRSSGRWRWSGGARSASNIRPPTHCQTIPKLDRQQDATRQAARCKQTRRPKCYARSSKKQTTRYKSGSRSRWTTKTPTHIDRRNSWSLNTSHTHTVTVCVWESVNECECARVCARVCASVRVCESAIVCVRQRYSGVRERVKALSNLGSPRNTCIQFRRYQNLLGA